MAENENDCETFDDYIHLKNGFDALWEPSWDEAPEAEVYSQLCYLLAAQGLSILNTYSTLIPVALFVRHRRPYAVALFDFTDDEEEERCYAAVSAIAEACVADGVVLMNDAFINLMPIEEFETSPRSAVCEEKLSSQNCLVMSVIRPDEGTAALVPYGVADDGSPFADSSVLAELLPQVAAPSIWMLRIQEALKRSRGRVPGGADEVEAIAQSFTPPLSTFGVFE